MTKQEQEALVISQKSGKIVKYFKFHCLFFNSLFHQFTRNLIIFIHSKEKVVSVDILPPTLTLVLFSRRDFGTDEHHRDGGRGRPGVVRAGSSSQENKKGSS